MWDGDDLGLGDRLHLVIISCSKLLKKSTKIVQYDALLDAKPSQMYVAPDPGS